MTDSNRPLSKGTCSVLFKSYLNNRDKLAPAPQVTISQTQKGIVLSWQPYTSNYTTIYIIEQTHHDKRMPSIIAVSIVGWIRDTRYEIEVKEVCNPITYRVMAINQFGTRGYSAQVNIPGLTPGPPQNIHYSGQGVYYHRTDRKFMAILEWSPPAGWSDDTIDHYEWGYNRTCQFISHDEIPMFGNMPNQPRRKLVTVKETAVGCKLFLQVRAVSKCPLDVHVPGIIANFTIDLTDCSSLNAYTCKSGQFSPPGLVENVTLSVTSTPTSVINAMFMHPSHINAFTQSPLLVNLHIHWQPPTDLGSEGVIGRYIIKRGRVDLQPVPFPPTFIESGYVSVVNSPTQKLKQDIVELTFPIPTQKMSYYYGVQVIAIAPDQNLTANEWGIFPIKTIQVLRNDSNITQQGTILLDEGGIIVVYVNRTLPIHFVFDTPMSRMDNYTGNKYIQWGPLVAPQKINVENETVVPLNQTMLRVYIQHNVRKYGIRIVHQSETEDEPNNVTWYTAPLLAFDVPEYTGDDTDGLTTDKIVVLAEDDQFNMIPVYIVCAVVVVVVMTTVGLRLFLRKHHYKNLERRLLHTEDAEYVDGDHYFVMRTSDSSRDEVDEIPTVVPDQWELPHCCLKIGRTIGSGAFGQVVRGRVSRSVLMHRGIDLHSNTVRPGTHVTVAIKMLQECTEQRYTDDFLKEIQMMKSIGYHSNIVSILGCCTLREPYCLVVEHVQHGDLLTFLRKIRQKIQESEDISGGYVNQDVEHFSPNDLLSVARQVTRGMEYLSQRGFVHRDLAARNVLVGENKTVKIGDFGLTRYIYEDVQKIYVNRRGGKLPLKWLSPESIFSMVFSTASDVWSFGIVLFEIVTLGGTPYPVLSHTELLQALKQGYRMDRPDNCSAEIYELMLSCWNYSPSCRPSFTQLCQTFTHMLEEDSGLEYFDFKVDEEREYYKINSDEMDTDILDVEDDDENTLDSAPDHLDDANLSLSTSALHLGVTSTSYNTMKESVHLSKTTVVIEHVPDDNCTTEAIPMKSDNEMEVETSQYTDTPFVRNCSESSSFHNGLYPDIDTSNVINDIITGTDCVTKDDNEMAKEMANKTGIVRGCNSNNSSHQLPVQNLSLPARKTSESDRSSRSSDDSEVFTNCNKCFKKTLTFEMTTEATVDTEKCLDCCHHSILPVERNDSAICSTTSDETSIRKGHNSESSNASSISDEYLMPDSPVKINSNENNHRDINHKQADFHGQNIKNEIFKFGPETSANKNKDVARYLENVVNNNNSESESENTGHVNHLMKNVYDELLHNHRKNMKGVQESLSIAETRL